LGRIISGNRRQTIAEWKQKERLPAAMQLKLRKLLKIEDRDGVF
jgi:hypothetical protein